MLTGCVLNLGILLVFFTVQFHCLATLVCWGIVTLMFSVNLCLATLVCGGGGGGGGGINQSGTLAVWQL